MAEFLQILVYEVSLVKEQFHALQTHDFVFEWFSNRWY